jgi:hypothetical protein
MTVVTYSDQYFLDVVQLIENFHKEAIGEYDDLFNPNAVIETIKTADHSNAFLLILDNKCQGILYGTRLKSPMSGKWIFQEVMWYVNEPFRRYGVKLLKEVENILKSDGVSIIIMAVLENSKTEKLKGLYERLGFKPMETHYMRSI